MTKEPTPLKEDSSTVTCACGGHFAGENTSHCRRVCKVYPRESANISVDTQKDERCAVCGWPLAASAERGCVVGICSFRPVPPVREWYSPVRAAKENTYYAERIAAETTLAPAAVSVDEDDLGDGMFSPMKHAERVNRVSVDEPKCASVHPAPPRASNVPDRWRCELAAGHVGEHRLFFDYNVWPWVDDTNHAAPVDELTAPQSEERMVVERVIASMRQEKCAVIWQSHRGKSCIEVLAWARANVSRELGGGGCAESYVRAVERDVCQSCRIHLLASELERATAPQTVSSPSSRDEPDLREQLAALAHEQWSGWMRYLFGCLEYAADADAEPRLITLSSYERWKRQTRTPYAELTEAEKESDRKEADRVLALCSSIYRKREEAKAVEINSLSAQVDRDSEDYTRAVFELKDMLSAAKRREEGLRAAIRKIAKEMRGDCAVYEPTLNRFADALTRIAEQGGKDRETR